MGDRIASIALGWHDAKRSFVCDLLSDLIAAIGFVGNDGEWWGEWWFLPVQKGVHHLAIMQLSARYGEAQRSSVRIYSGMNLGCAASA